MKKVSCIFMIMSNFAKCNAIYASEGITLTARFSSHEQPMTYFNTIAVGKDFISVSNRDLNKNKSIRSVLLSPSGGRKCLPSRTPLIYTDCYEIKKIDTNEISVHYSQDGRNLVSYDFFYILNWHNNVCDIRNVRVLIGTNREKNEVSANFTKCFFGPYDDAMWAD